MGALWGINEVIVVCNFLEFVSVAVVEYVCVVMFVVGEEEVEALEEVELEFSLL